MGLIGDLTPEEYENNLQAYEGYSREEAIAAFAKHAQRVDSGTDAKTEIVARPEFQALIDATPLEISTWVDNADLDQLRTAIKLLLIVARFVVRRFILLG